MSEEENIKRITTSSALLLQLHDIDTNDIQKFLEDTKVGKGGTTGVKSKKPNAREFIEHRGPQVQGKNALALAEHIIKKSEDPSYKDLQELANKFNDNWKSNTCYLCGQKIIEGQDEELEHIVPVAEAFAVLDIIQDNQTEFKKKLDEPMNPEKEGTYRKYLLEYRRSHACCNQLKSNTSFLHWDKANNYVVNELVLKNFFARLHSVIGGTKFRSEERVCGNKDLIKDQKERNKKTFIDLRTTDVTNNYLNPIATFVTEQRSKLGENMMELSYLANQALSVHPVIWLMKKGDASLTTKESDIETFKTDVINKLPTKYEAVRGNILLKLLLSPQLRDNEIKKYYDARITKDDQDMSNNNISVRRSPRTLPRKEFEGLINADFAYFRNRHQEICKEKWPDWKANFEHECWFGIYFFNLLLDSQKLDKTKLPDNWKLITDFPSMKYLEKDINPMAELIKQINNYVIFYVYMHIIFTVNSESSYKFDKFDYILSGMYPEDIMSSVETFLNEDQYKTSGEYVNFHLERADVIISLISKTLPHYNFILKESGSFFIDGRSPISFTKEIINKNRMFAKEKEVATEMIKMKRNYDLAYKYSTIWAEQAGVSAKEKEAIDSLKSLATKGLGKKTVNIGAELDREYKETVEDDDELVARALLDLIPASAPASPPDPAPDPDPAPVAAVEDPDVEFMKAVKALQESPDTKTVQQYLDEDAPSSAIAGAKYKYIPPVTYVYGKYITDPITKQQNSVKNRRKKTKANRKKRKTKKVKPDPKRTSKYPKITKTKRSKK